MRVLIKVEAEDIANGLSGRARFCPVALAVKRQTRPGYDIAVGPSQINVTEENDKWNKDHWPLPRSATRFINKFDSNVVCKPFNFFLHITEEQAGMGVV